MEFTNALIQGDLEAVRRCVLVGVFKYQKTYQTLCLYGVPQIAFQSPLRFLTASRWDADVCSACN